MNLLYGILLIILTNLLFFYQTLNYHYISDDLPVSQRPGDAPKSTWKRLWMQFRGDKYFIPKEAHIITLTIHIINCILVYLVCKGSGVGLVAAIFFSINPINTQGGSIWISGKPYSCATLFTLAGFAFPWVAPLTYLTSAYFSASALLSPLPFLLTRFWFLALLTPLAFGIFWSVIRRKWRLNLTTNAEMRTVTVKKLIPFFKTFGYYFRLCIMPYKLGLYHNFIWGIGVNKYYKKIVYKINKDFWIGLVIFIGCLLRIVLVRDQVSFGLFWFVINIIMWCNLITIQQQIGERYVYLANVGLMIALAAFLSTLPFSSTLIAIVLTYYATRLWYYREAYTNDYWQVEYNVIEQKNSHYAWVSRGIKKYYLLDFPGAMMDFGEARIHNKHDFKQNMNLATIFLGLGDITRCEEHLKYAEDTLYQDVEERQREEYITHTKGLVEIAKKTGQVAIKDLRIIR